MKKHFAVLLLVSSFLLYGCVNRVDSTPDPGPSASQTLTIDWLDAKRTQNAGTITAYAQTPVATRWPATPTPTPILGFNFPDWVSSPAANVLLIPTGTHEAGYQNLALINASTGERFDFPPLDFGGYFWTEDGKSIGLLSYDLTRVTLIDTLTGLASHYPLEAAATEFISETYEGGPPDDYAAYGKVGSPEFRLLNKWQQVSAGGKYVVGLFSYESTAVYDLISGEKIQVTDPEDDVYDLDSAWSPVAPYLVVVHSDQIPGLSLNFKETPRIELAIYDLETMEVVDTVKDIAFPNWSPDGSKFLYQKVEPGDWYAENPPCVFDLVARTEKCYDQLTSLHRAETTEQLLISWLRWSPDQKKINYIFTAAVPDARKSFGGLCFITLVDDSIRCVLEEFEQPGEKVVYHRWSEDGRYIYFHYDIHGPLGDNPLDPKAGVYDVTTGRYVLIENALASFFGSDGALFRPLVDE